MGFAAAGDAKLSQSRARPGEGRLLEGEGVVLPPRKIIYLTGADLINVVYLV